MERWLPVVGYEGLYEVSNYGVVRSLNRKVELRTKWDSVVERFVKGRVIVQQDNGTGYKTAGLSRDSKQRQLYVHRLVAEAFIGPPPNPEAWHVCHNDGTTDNNAVENLRYATPKGNNSDKIKHGTEQVGERNPAAKLTDAQAQAAIDRVLAGEVQRRVAADVGISPAQMSKMVRGDTWKHLSRAAELFD